MDSTSAQWLFFSHAFREREDLCDVYEATSGARPHAAYFRPGGVYRDSPDRMPQYEVSRVHSEDEVRQKNINREGSVLDFIESFVERFPDCVDEYENFLTDNRIWKQRTVDIGIVTPERAMQLGFTGPMLRGSGIKWDLRRKQPYEVYPELDFDIPVGVTGIATTVTLFGSKRCVSPIMLFASALIGFVRIRDR